MIMAGANTYKDLKQCVTVKISPTFPSEDSAELTMAVTPKLPPSTPPPDPEFITRNPILKNLQLADGDFGGWMDVLIGTLDLP